MSQRCFVNKKPDDFTSAIGTSSKQRLKITNNDPPIHKSKKKKVGGKHPSSSNNHMQPIRLVPIKKVQSNEPTPSIKIKTEPQPIFNTFKPIIRIKTEPVDDTNQKHGSSSSSVVVDDIFMEVSDISTDNMTYEPMTIENIVETPPKNVPSKEGESLIRKKIDIIDTKNNERLHKTHKIDTTRTRLATTILTGKELCPEDSLIDSQLKQVEHRNSITAKPPISHSELISKTIESNNGTKSVIDNIDRLCEKVFNIGDNITSLNQFIHNGCTSLPTTIPGHPITHTLIKFAKEINDNSKHTSNINQVIPCLDRNWVESMLYEPSEKIWPLCSSGANCIGNKIFPEHKVTLRSFYASCEKRAETKDVAQTVEEETKRLNRSLTEDEYNNIIRTHAQRTLVPIVDLNGQKPTPGPCFLCLCTFIINTSIHYMLASFKCPSNIFWNPVRVLTGIKGEFPIHACFYDNGKNNMICDAIYCPSIHTLEPVVCDGLKGFKFSFRNNDGSDYHFLA